MSEFKEINNAVGEVLDFLDGKELSLNKKIVVLRSAASLINESMIMELGLKSIAVGLSNSLKSK